MEYYLTRSKRLTIGIHVKQGIVEVRAPLHCPQEQIETLLKEKEAWIEQALLRQKLLLAQQEAFRLDYGGTVLLRGREYPIAAHGGKAFGFDGERFLLPPDLPPEAIKQAVIQIYRRVAKNVLPEKVRVYAARMGVTPGMVGITGAKTRWGSCSGNNGNLNFSWRLILAEEDAIDYVVVHELAHLKEANHSKRFWAEVQAILPDYRQRRQSLLALQARLQTENWETDAER